MKRLQFSLATLLAFNVLVAMVVLLCGGVASEPALQAIWVGSFLFPYWKGSVVGWRQVVRVTATVAVAWGACILCTYFWCMNQIGRARVALVIHGVLIVLVGIVAAFAGAVSLRRHAGSCDLGQAWRGGAAWLSPCLCSYWR